MPGAKKTFIAPSLARLMEDARAMSVFISITPLPHGWLLRVGSHDVPINDLSESSSIISRQLQLVRRRRAPPLPSKTDLGKTKL